MLPRVLVADADPSLLGTLEELLAAGGYEVLCATTPESALDRARRSLPTLILWGFDETDGGPGPASVVRHLPDASLVLISDDAAPGMRDAQRDQTPPAFDDLLPRTEPERELGLVLHRAGVQASLRRERRLLAREVREDPGNRPIVGASSQMIALLEAMERAAGFDTPVLLCGERGTGKEGLARTLHAQSQRRRGAFVTVRCPNRSESDLGPAIFGQVHATATTRPGRLLEAAGGTLFLDGVDALPERLQEKLLETLQTESVIPYGEDKPWPVDVRILAASASDLQQDIADGTFRGDLHARLGQVTLRVPALRERTSDIPLLLDHFIQRSCRAIGRPALGMSDEVIERLVAYAWPGNVRELQNVVERAVILAAGERLLLRDLPERLEPLEAPEARRADLGLRRARRQLEVDLIRRALRRTGGNRTHAARLLEISHRALLYKIKEYGVTD